MGLRRTFTEYKPDRSIVKVTMLDGKVISEKVVKNEKFLFNGSATLNFGIKELKRSGAPKKLIREFKDGAWDNFRTQVEAKLAEGAKK
jgi:hypothetical protein